MAKKITKAFSFALAIVLSLLSSAFITGSASVNAISLIPSDNYIPVNNSVSPFFCLFESSSKNAPLLFSDSSLTPLKNSSHSNVSYKDLKLYPGGMPFGVKFITEGILIVGFNDIQSDTETVNPSRQAGLRCNDLILKINGVSLLGAAELSEIVQNSNGQPLQILYSRDGVQYSTVLHPVFSKKEGRYVSGIYVRDSGAGIGTITFIHPDNHYFAGLGHGICDGDTGELIPMQRGSVVGVTISGVVRGLAGSPGEIKGYFSSGKVGTLLGNTECGVYGVLASLPDKIPCEPLPIGSRSEIKEGKAYIYCALDSETTQKYEIQICDIHRDSTSNKCFTVKITDQALIDKTGGIIQGMSGSPIIQNGKLVGAVTHVLINDPTTGYGIFIENMLNQMGDLAG